MRSCLACWLRRSTSRSAVALLASGEVWIYTSAMPLVSSLGLPLLGGALIGLGAALLWLWNGRIAGVSGIASGLWRAEAGDRGWRGMFLLGLVAGGVLMRYALPAAFEGASTAPSTTLFAGLLVGVGTTLANGCTSGHAVCGVSRLSPRSLAATCAFMAAGGLAVYIARHVLGAPP